MQPQTTIDRAGDGEHARPNAATHGRSTAMREPIPIICRKSPLNSALITPEDKVLRDCRQSGRGLIFSADRAAARRISAMEAASQ